jgi:DNA-binding HxlR family transcriptional regulator
MNEVSKKVDCAGEEWCPITATSSLICKKWHPVIVHCLLENGPLGFNALKREVGGISAKVLTNSLSNLVERDIVVREEISKKPVRVDYSLTELGQSLEPVITVMYDWGDEHLESIE